MKAFKLRLHPVKLLLVQGSLIEQIKFLTASYFKDRREIVEEAFRVGHHETASHVLGRPFVDVVLRKQPVVRLEGRENL